MLPMLLSRASGNRRTAVEVLVPKQSCLCGGGALSGSLKMDTQNGVMDFFFNGMFGLMFLERLLLLERN